MAAVQARGRRFSRAASSPWDYNFGTPHTRGNVNGHVKLNYYSKLNRSPFDPDIAVNSSLRHAVSERLILSATADIRYRVEPDFEIEGSSNRKRGNYFFNRDELSASYRWLPSCCQRCRLPTPIRFLLLTMNLKVATRFIQSILGGVTFSITSKLPQAAEFSSVHPISQTAVAHLTCHPPSRQADLGE